MMVDLARHLENKIRSEEPVKTIIGLAPRIFSCDKAAAETVAALLSRASICILPRLDRAFHSSAVYASMCWLGYEDTSLTLDELKKLGRMSWVGYGLASFMRDGYIREAAVRRLDHSMGNHLTIGFLINRLNDSVLPIAHVAETALEEYLDPKFAQSFVACLPLIARAACWIRSCQSDVLSNIIKMVASSNRECRQALWQGAEQGKGEVRLHACKLLVQILQGKDEIERALVAALMAVEPSTRNWVGHIIGNGNFTPISVRRQLLPRLQLDRSAQLRLLATRWYARERNWEMVQHAAFDHNRRVRLYARKYLKKSGKDIEYRLEALVILHNSNSSKHKIISALAVLSEFGRSEDVPKIAPFLRDARNKISVEARRTLALLTNQNTGVTLN